MMHLVHPKPGAFRPRVSDWFRYPVRYECQTAQQRSGEYDICRCLPPDRTWHKLKSPKADKSGDKGEGERAETRTLLICAAHRPTKCNVALMRQAVSRIQIWIRARMTGYSLNQTTRSSAIHREQRLQLAHPKVAQPKLGAFWPRICHCSIPHPTRMPDGPAKRPGKYLALGSMFWIIEGIRAKKSWSQTIVRRFLQSTRFYAQRKNGADTTIWSSQKNCYR